MTQLFLNGFTLKINDIMFDGIEDEHASWKSFLILMIVPSMGLLVAVGSTLDLSSSAFYKIFLVFWKVDWNNASDFILPQLGY